MVSRDGKSDPQLPGKSLDLGLSRIGALTPASSDPAYQMVRALARIRPFRPKVTTLQR